MQRLLLAIALLACAAVPVGIYVAVRATVSEQGEQTAQQQLTELSARGRGATYGATYVTSVLQEPQVSFRYTSAPGFGVRFDFSEPVDVSEDTGDDVDEILKNGDVFFLRPTDPFAVSCRTERQSCRSAGGSEVIFLASLGALFLYPEGYMFAVAPPHFVEEAAEIKVGSETGRCFLIQEEEPGAPPVRICYANDGIPVYFGGGLAEPPTGGLSAIEISREVDETAFDLPFPFVPSTYDD